MRYNIVGESLPVVICDLAPGETMITERGSMCWMTPNIQMQTTSNGGFGKAFGRFFTGDSFFQNRYTAMGGNGQIAFASSFPGAIRAVEIRPGRDLIVQKRLGSGLFGGEGIIMQRLSGEGLAFIEIDGSAHEYDLAVGQSMIVDTGYLAAMDATCTMDIQTVPGIKNALFGGEGIFNTVVTGPGKVILQTMPVSAVANAIRPYIPTKSD